MTLGNWFVVELSGNDFATIVNNTTNQTCDILNLTYQLVLLNNSTKNRTVVDTSGLPYFTVNVIWTLPNSTVVNVLLGDARNIHSRTFSLIGYYILEASSDNEKVRLNLNITPLTKIYTNSTINSNDIFIGQETIITGIATDNNGKPLANTQIQITINNNKTNITTNNNGEWELPQTPTTTGTHTISVTWEGNSTHEGFSNSTSFTVNEKYTTSSTINTNDIFIGQETIITGIATDNNGKPLANTQIQITINNNKTNITTNNNGEWELPQTPTTTGTHTISVTWEGNSTHEGFSNSTSFTVREKYTTNTVISADNIIIGQETTIKGIATDNNGNALANIQIQITINSNTITVTTNSNGAWTLVQTPTTTGTYSILVTWEGNSTHEGFTNSATFNVGNNEVIDGDDSEETSKNKTIDDSHSKNTNNRQNKDDNKNKKANNNKTTANASMKKTGTSLIAMLLTLLFSLTLATKRKL